MTPAKPDQSPGPPRPPAGWFALLGYEPVLAAFGNLSVGSLPDRAAGGGSGNGAYGATGLVHTALFVIFPITVTTATYRAFGRTGSPVLRALPLYVGWLAMATGFLYALLGALGGASEAVAEGLLTPAELRRQVLAETSRSLVPFHLFVIPWVALSAIALGRLGRPEAARAGIATAGPPVLEGSAAEGVPVPASDDPAQGHSQISA